MINVTVKSDQLKQLTDSLNAIPGAVASAGTRALNTTATAVKNESGRLVSGEYMISCKEITSRRKVDRAKQGILQADIIGSDKRGLPKIKFVAKKYQGGPSTKPVGGGRYSPAVGVSVKLKRADSFSPSPGAFVQRMSSGHIGLFTQVPGNKDRIREEIMASPLYVLAKKRHSDKINKFIDKTLPGKLTEQINKELKDV